MTALRVGVQLQPQGTSVAALRDAWCRYEEAGVDSIWLWDHLRPFVGDPSARALDAVTLLGLLAADTARATIGIMVSPLTFRHPALLARSTAVAHEASGGRVVLGVGAGGFAPDDVLVNELTTTGETGVGSASSAVSTSCSPSWRMSSRRGSNRRVCSSPARVGGRCCLSPPVTPTPGTPSDRLPRMPRRTTGWTVSAVGKAAIRVPSSAPSSCVAPTIRSNPAAFVAAGATHLIRSVRAPYDDAVDVDLVRTLLDLQG